MDARLRSIRSSLCGAPGDGEIAEGATPEGSPLGRPPMFTLRSRYRTVTPAYILEEGGHFPGTLLETGRLSSLDGQSTMASREDSGVRTSAACPTPSRARSATPRWSGDSRTPLDAQAAAPA